MIPICSFKLKPKLRKIPQANPFTHSLGEYIRHERIKRHIKQETLAEQFGVNGVALSNWELNRKPIHPKRFNDMIDFLGFVPSRQSDFDKLGTRTQLWRLQNHISFGDFISMFNLDKEDVTKIETARYCKIDDELKDTITRHIQLPISHEVLS
mgnify:CR=1 FL=1